MQIQYSSVQTSGAAIHVVNSENVRVLRCVLQDCPQGVYFEQSVQGSMTDCTAIYPLIGEGSVAGTAVILGNPSNDNTATDTYIAGCTFRSSSNPPSGVGIQINGVEHLRIANTRIEGFQQGVLVTAGSTSAEKIHMENVDCFPGSHTTGTGAGFLIKPGAGLTVWNVCLVNCKATPGTSGTSYTGAGFAIDASSGSETVIDDIRLVSCFSAGWNGPGLELIAGSNTLENVQVDGGAYICNGQGGTTGAPGSGIYVNGAANGVYIDHAQLDNYSSQYSATQTYAVAFYNGALNVFVRSCAMSNLATAPVYASGQGAHCWVINCRSYNETATLVADIAHLPANGVQFDGTTVGPTAYFGPILVMWSGGTVSNSKISHDRDGLVALTTGVTSGVFPLAVGQSLELDYTVAPTVFNVFGQ